MVGDKHIDVPKELHRSVHNGCRSFGQSEIGLNVFEAFSMLSQRLHHTGHTHGVTTPWLFGVMRCPRLDQHGHSRFQQIARNGKPDSRPSTDSGDDGDPACRRGGHFPSSGTRIVRQRLQHGSSNCTKCRSRIPRTLADAALGMAPISGLVERSSPLPGVVAPGRAQPSPARRRSSDRSPSIGTRTCSVVSRSRTVTASSSSESKSTVTHHGVPTSSWRR